MSYHRKPRTSFGLGDASSVVSKVVSGVQTAVDVSADPYLSETICRVQQLIAIENNRPVPICNETPSGLVGGIGLRRAMPILRGYVYAQQHPWVYPVAGAVAVGIPVLIGYLLGKGSRR